MAEAPIQRQILASLHRAGVFVWRANVGGARLPSGAVIKFGIRGQPDLIGMLPDGRFLGIETKAERGRQSPVQRAFQARCDRNRAVYLIARSLDEARTALVPYGVAL